MKIRRTRVGDIPELLDVFAYGRDFQRQTGNMNQWVEGYPSESLIKEDIEQEISYVCVRKVFEDNGAVKEEIVATFVLLKEPDPTYEYIENGAWLNDEPYVTIHRIAANGKEKGAGQYCIEWVKEHFDNIKIDTHLDNQPMIHVVKKHGFVYCGVIYLADGSARNAYQYAKGN